ncbi:MAG: phage head morphogenesis protein [Streptococcaceae bacterium]|jgi:uncharacterized protein with gpF-like domain|nr:phage head morphogenesis protein [Streptococcaceae bacterium]MCH4176199.1 phage head morphogenesis protein [Streptococcaceae bacterium]
MNKYQSEIEKLLQNSEKDLSKDLLSAYQSVYNEVNDQVKQLVEDAEKLNFTQKMQSERLQLIKQQLQISIDELQGVNNRKIYNYLDTVGQTGYNELFYEFEQTTGIPISFSMLDNKTIETIIQTPVASRKLSTRLQGNVTKLKQSINHELTRGFAKGDSYAKIARRIANVGDSKYKRAMSIARTEGGRVSSITRQKSQNDITTKGVEIEKQWSAALDMKTRSDHAQLDGTTIPIKEYFKVSGYKALQPHMFGVAEEDCGCRCRTISVIKGYELKLRRDNETHEVDKYKNYQEWLKDKHYQANNAIIGVKTVDGIEIKRTSQHLAERTILREVNPNEIIDALVNPIHIRPDKTDNNGTSRKYVGRIVSVVVNPDTGTVVTTHKTGSRTVRKYTKKG